MFVSLPAHLLYYMPPHDKTDKMIYAPSKDSDQPGHPPSLIRVFAVHSMGNSGPKVSSCGQRRLWSDQTGLMPRLIWVFVGCTCHFVGFVVRRLIYTSRVIGERVKSPLITCVPCGSGWPIFAFCVSCSAINPHHLLSQFTFISLSKAITVLCQVMWGQENNLFIVLLHSFTRKHGMIILRFSLFIYSNFLY